MKKEIKVDVIENGITEIGLGNQIISHLSNLSKEEMMNVFGGKNCTSLNSCGTYTELKFNFWIA